MAFNLENMTVDYKKMLRMIPSDRTTLAQSGAINDLISSLTPGQLVNLFPSYYRDQLPDVGQAVSSGSRSSLGGALSGGTSFDGGGSTYTGSTTKPLKSPSAEEKAVQVTDYLEEKWGVYDGYMEIYDYLESLFMDEI